MRLLFQDEGRFGRISDHRRCWAPLPLRPLVGQQVIREYVYVLTAVSPRDGKLVSLIMPWVDAEVMSIFLDHTSQTFPEDLCLMFLDGAGWHRANSLRIPENLVLMALPPYSPELNPVEHIWEYLRENALGNRNYSSLEEVIDVLCEAIRPLFQQPDLVRSMTCFNWINSLCLMYN